MKEFTHAPRGLVHIDGRLARETETTFTIHYWCGRIRLNKCDVYNCNVRPDRTIVVDVSPDIYPRARARTESVCLHGNEGNLAQLIKLTPTRERKSRRKRKRTQAS